MSDKIRAAASRFVAQRGPLREPVASECGHSQALPTATEIVGGPEIVVRACAACGVELWWNAGEWRRL